MPPAKSAKRSGISRRLPDWIRAFEEYTKNSESPKMYHIWAACSTLAAVMQRRCYMKWGHETIYPNLYVILVGPSGRVRKGDPINISKSFLKPLKLPMIGESNTPEYIAKFMAEAIQNYKERGTNRIISHSSVTCFVEELSVLTGERNTPFLAALTNWYDGRDDWDRGTKNAGYDAVRGVWFNMLAATAPDWLPFIFTKEAMGGGFTSRCTFVVEDKKSQIIANPNLLMPSMDLKQRMSYDLELILSMSGEFKFSEEALALYERWYTDTEQRADTVSSDVEDSALQGYASRRATHIKKLGMIMSVSRAMDYTITATDFTRAKTLLEITEKRMPSVFAGIGTARYARETDVILGYIVRQGEVTKEQLLRNHYRMVDNVSLQSILTVLSEMHRIQVIRSSTGSYTYKSLV